jgi:uncharacterized SAM-binding protein YcdF (DUF218 family)
MSLLPKVLLCSLACIICIAILQIGAFFYLASRQKNLTSADLVVVLPGSSERISAGCRTAVETKTDNLMLINSSTKKLQNYAKKNNVPETVKLLAGGSSRSSFEDVYNTVQTIKNHHFTSIIVVTSDYHIPRILFLLYTHLAFSKKGVSIQFKSTQKQHKLNQILRLYYNEVVKLWGSSVEMGGYLVNNQLMLDSKRFLQIRTWLKSHLLFQV